MKHFLFVTLALALALTVVGVLSNGGRPKIQEKGGPGVSGRVTFSGPVYKDHTQIICWNARLFGPVTCTTYLIPGGIPVRRGTRIWVSGEGMTLR